MNNEHCARCGSVCFPQPFSPRENGAPVCINCLTPEEMAEYDANADAMVEAYLDEKERQAEEDHRAEYGDDDA